MVPWRDAWQDALYGERGFYRSPAGPAGHFTTGAHGATGPLLAEALLLLLDREGLSGLVDVGAGRGELLGALHALRPALPLTGVDVVERPDGTPDGVAWVVSPGGAHLPDPLTGLADLLVVAHEWLDVVPCTVAEVVAPGRLAVVLVDRRTGAESPTGPAPTDEELAWCDEHWPVAGLPVGARVEVGLARDRAWAGLLSRVGRGTVLAVDYGHTAGARPRGGTLTAYRSGALVPAVPDGTCDLTAHVAVDSLEHDVVTTQRDALRGLGLRAAPPPQALARADPPAYLAALARRSALGALTDPRGLGGFRWVLRRVGS
ncbi:MAG TPA: SAM-dependent methyltransferase [Dermatophilaceae bacterium]|nr:SAM-dependent methyltransferase [Dermatophilaceae bacterium]